MRAKYMRAASIVAAAAGESQENDALRSDGMKEGNKEGQTQQTPKSFFFFFYGNRC